MDKKIKTAVRDLHWMARRYADGRSSYAPGTFNGRVRDLMAAGFELEQPLFARDGMGRAFDGLSDEEVVAAEADMPRMHTKVIEAGEERFNDVWDQAVEACISRVNTQRAIFADEEYSSGQPYTTMAERFACEQIAEDLRSLMRSDKTESDNGGCQADTGAKGETVSAPLEPLQSGLSADALKPCPFCGSEPHVRQYTDEDLWSHNQVEWTQVTCSNCDVGFAWPPGGEHGSAIEQWNRRAANSQSQIEEAHRADTERPANAEGTLTPPTHLTNNTGGRDG